MYLSAGQTSDYMGAAALLSSLPQATTLLADRGYDANWFRNALIDRGIQSCIPSRKNRLVQIPHDTVLYQKRHMIENMFAHQRLGACAERNAGRATARSPAYRALSPRSMNRHDEVCKSLVHR